MKSLKDILVEGILGDTDTVLSDGDKYMTRLNSIGGKLKIVSVAGMYFNRICKSGNASKAALKKATKDYYVSEELKNIVKDYKSLGVDDNVKMLIQWIENQKLNSLPDLNELSKPNNALSQAAIEAGIISKKNGGIWIKPSTYSVMKSDYLIEIVFNDCKLTLFYNVRN